MPTSMPWKATLNQPGLVPMLTPNGVDDFGTVLLADTLGCVLCVFVSPDRSSGSHKVPAESSSTSLEDFVSHKCSVALVPRRDRYHCSEKQNTHVGGRPNVSLPEPNGLSFVSRSSRLL